MTRLAPKHKPKVASYTEYHHGGRFLHIKGPEKEARELAGIAMKTPGTRMIEEIRWVTTGMTEIIIKLADA